MREGLGFVAGEPVAPGWYNDPYQKGTYRYWDGTKWTEATTSPSGAPPDDVHSSASESAVVTSQLTTRPGDDRSPVGTFVGIWAFTTIAWCAGFGALGALVMDDPPSPTVLLVSGVAFGVAMASIGTKKATPHRAELGVKLTAPRRAALRVCAAELGLKIERDEADVVEFAPTRAGGMSLAGLSIGPPTVHIAVHAIGDRTVIIGPRAIVERLAESVTS